MLIIETTKSIMKLRNIIRTKYMNHFKRAAKHLVLYSTKQDRETEAELDADRRVLMVAY